jgi:diguanylate cyclase (GGDEF)-like protein
MPSRVPNGSFPWPAQRPGRIRADGACPPFLAGSPADGAVPNLVAEPLGLSRRVLLVEPSGNERARLHEQLTAGQMEVYEAGDVLAAVEAVPSVQPDLILAQMSLQGWSGLGLIRYLKEDQAARSIPVILYSDIATVEERVRAFDLGAVDFLSPPPAGAELVARVRAALRVRHAMTVLERRAHRDGLTGLVNRVAMEDHLHREWNAWRRHGAPLAVLIADLDHFKAINDTYGHAAGDDVLCQAAEVLSRAVRSSDLAARYGGEEFVVVAPDCPREAAVTLATRFRSGLAEVAISVPGASVAITASVGIAGTTDATLGSPEELLRQADQALYEAKRSGRDAIAIHDPSRGGPSVIVGPGARGTSPSGFRLTPGG